MRQITPDNLLLFRMTGQPAFPVAQQLLNFVVTHVVVLGSVEDRNQDIKVRQQLRQPLRSGNRDRVIGTFAPVGKTSIQRMPDKIDGIAQRFKDPPNPAFTAANGKYLETGGNRQWRLR